MKDYMPFLSIVFVLCCGILIGTYLKLGNTKTPLPLSSEVLIVVTVPEEHADAMRTAIGQAGAGKVGNYTYCSFSYKGTGRFIPGEGAHPAIGKVGSLASVKEEIIQVPCPVALLDQVITAIKHVHPYEEPGIDLIPFYHYDHKKINA